MRKLILLLFFLPALVFAQNKAKNTTVRNNLVTAERIYQALQAGVTFTAASTDTYTVNTGLNLTFAADDKITVFFTNPNTVTTPTLNIDAGGAHTIVDNEGDALTVGALEGPVDLMYDGTNYRVIGGSGGGGGSGTVSSVGLTLGTSGTDAGVSGSPVTTSGNITLNLPSSSASNRGLLTSSDWTAFNNKITGPGSATDDAIVTYDGTTGKLAQNSGTLIDNGTLDGGTTTNVPTKSAVLNFVAWARREVTSADDNDQTDANGIIKLNSATPFNFTLDQLLDETVMQFINYGAGAVTFINGSGVTAAGNLVLPGAVGTNYPMAAVIYDSPTTPRVVNGLVIGSNLSDIEALVPAESDFIQYKSGAWTNRTLAQARNDIGSTTIFPVYQNPTNLTLTDQANSEDYLGGSSIYSGRFDAVAYNSVRVTALITTGSASGNSPRLYPQYTTDLTGATGWTTIGSGVGGEVISMTSTGSKTTSFITLPAPSKSEVLFRVAQHGGNASADPAINNVKLQFKQ